MNNLPLDDIVEVHCKLCSFVGHAKDKKFLNTSLGTHLKRKHSLETIDYVKQFPDQEYLLGVHDRRLFAIQSKSSNQIECQVCHDILSRINNKHLAKHKMTSQEYRALYGTTMSLDSHLKGSVATQKLNAISKQKSLSTGAPLVFHTPEAIDTRIRHNYEDYLILYTNEYFNYTSFENYKLKKYSFQCKKCNNYFESENKIPRCYKCMPKHFLSKEQKELFDFITIDLQIKNVKYNYRKIGNTEFDIFLPNYKIAIEYDGLYWHCETSNNRTMSYHLNKTDFGLKHSIRVIHIFSDEWINKKDIVKSRIKNLLNKNSFTLGARQCEIRVITVKEAQTFLLLHHIQGYTQSKIKLGAFYKEELVAVMTLGSLRKALGNAHKQKDVYELLRFCSKSNYNIMGIGSKLFSYFVRNYNPTKVISYADKRWTPDYKNSFYNKLNFKYLYTSKPNYWYTFDYLIRFYRFEFRLQKLQQEGYDTKSFTEWEIMQQKKYDRIWDCGSHKYEWIR